MTTAQTASGALDMGGVIQTTFSVIQRNIGPFVLLSLIFSGLPALLVGVGRIAGLGGDDGSGAAALSTVALFVGSFVSIVFGSILQGALVHMSAVDLSGRRPAVVDGLATGLRNFLPLIGIGILYGLGFMFGLMLLVAPGVILATMWSVTVPARIVERTGIFAAFGRSRNLTRGSRWRILGLAAIYAVLTMVVQAVVLSLTGGIAGAGDKFFIGVLIASMISGTLNGMVGATGIAVLYTELRRLRDGVGVEELAAVFD